ncbi:GNAT family N-acetyltransferase [Luteolibacter pohnpeiensis]|uniref:GNAT family N-acetyltransferase n=1 Tax=Luteolibacter pohnpeiensis TaxID=454153 RepID=A0A934S4U0_9BACT|nr:GNAT family N-acetyltransferase [Luteolibacter pohnpeiensis]MBK1882287.1 GNAT family N-acetyltransferase [Luteolibacter pohnpeiensis]
MNHSDIRFYPSSDIPPLPLLEGLPSPDELAPMSEMPDGRIFLLNAQGQAVAHTALWWNHTPCLEGNEVGAIGGFAALGEIEAVALLEAAVKELQAQGVQKVVGPMNGNTWRRYRYIAESTGRGPFLLEPRNPASYPEWWRAAGFHEIAAYSSSTILLDGQPTVADALKKRLLKSGLTIRPIDLNRYEEELRAIYTICLKSFASNFLYTPLSEEGFLGAYRKLKDRIDAELVKIVERDGVACGFVFAIADLEAAARGEKPALIIKTLAVDPEARCPGLGSVLVDEVQMLGYQKGFSTALHVLQFDDNNVRRITTRHHGETFRRYSLFAR